MKAYDFSYFIKEGVSSAIKNSIMTIASVGVLIACLIIMGSFMLVSENINQILKDIESQNEVVTFINENLTLDQAKAIKNEILKIDNVKSADFIDKEQAFEEYKKSIVDGEELLAGIENPIRHSYRIYLKDISLMSDTIGKLEKIDGIAKVRGREDISQNLVKLKNILSFVMVWFFAVLLAISVFIISNTIKLAMFARKKEISIMKHVGATDWFIRWPFIIEGVFIALIGSIISFFLQWYIYSYITNKVLSGIQLIKLLPFDVFKWQILGSFILAGLVVGIFGSLWSVRKYLKA